MKLFIYSIFFVGFCFALPASADLISIQMLIDKGVAAYNKGDYPAALVEFRKAAEQGNATAQYNIGMMYDFGEGVRQDDFTAAEWYQKAAAQGYPDAQLNLGVKYVEGKGVRQSKDEALYWFGEACDNKVQKGCDNYARLKKMF